MSWFSLRRAAVVGAVAVGLCVQTPAAAWAGPAEPGTAASERQVSSTVASPQQFGVSATLDGRTAMALSNHAAPDRYRKNEKVLITCQSTGPETYGGSTVWDLTADGLWIPDYFVSTGHLDFTPDLPQCTLPKRFTAKAALDGRTLKDMRTHAHPNLYKKGTKVTILCQAYGGATSKGSYLWDKTSDGYWVPDHFVKTGSSGPVLGLPRCDLEAPAQVKGKRLRPGDLTVSAAGASFIAEYERYVGRPYNDAGGHCTIGYGHLIRGGRCTSRDIRTWGRLGKDAALGLLWRDLNQFAAGVRSTLPNTPLGQSEFDALVSLSYNIGVGGFRRSSVRSDLAQAPPAYEAVPEHMLRWVYSGGRRLCGLYKRRVNEGELFASGSYVIDEVRCRG